MLEGTGLGAAAPRVKAARLGSLVLNCGGRGCATWVFLWVSVYMGQRMWAGVRIGVRG